MHRIDNAPLQAIQQNSRQPFDVRSLAQSHPLTSPITMTEPRAAKPGISSATPASPSRRSAWFTIPGPLRKLFKQFPLVMYPANDLPARSPGSQPLPTLYIFTTPQDALDGLPSFNPSCLKWQAFLKLAGVAFRVVSSTNHASPTGALPFLIPPSSTGASAGDPADAQLPVPADKLEQYALTYGISKVSEAPSSKLEAYQALLDGQIRCAWLYALYLSPSNTKVLCSLYVDPVSSSQVVQTTVLHQLRSAAEKEILQSTGAPTIDPAALLDAARGAFEALEAALGSDDWFFGNSGPGLFDASLFAYTYLLLADDRLDWVDSRLKDTLSEFPGLVSHEQRVYERCWGSKK